MGETLTKTQGRGMVTQPRGETLTKYLERNAHKTPGDTLTKYLEMNACTKPRVETLTKYLERNAHKNPGRNAHKTPGRNSHKTLGKRSQFVIVILSDQYSYYWLQFRLIFQLKF